MADPDKQVLHAANGLGCMVFAAAFVLIPLLLPAILLYKIAVFAGAGRLHPAVMIMLGAVSIWGLWRLGGLLIRSVSPQIARLAIAAYVGACYTFVFFQYEITNKQAELDVAWLTLAFVVFAFFGWKVGGLMVLKAHTDQLYRSRRNNDKG